MIAILLVATSVAAAPPSCSIDDADKLANAKLSFVEFDQQGILPTTARSLGERGCWAEAAAATADYLIRGPIAKPEEQRILLFHLGQQFALAGEERRAADFIAAARQPEARESEAEKLNWNGYVTGTWAFLVKDRGLLKQMRDAVLASPGRPNTVNGAFLSALERCFDEPYSVAYDLKCGVTK